MPLDTLEHKAWAVDDAIAEWRMAKTNRARSAALTRARMAVEELADELDRLSEEEDTKAA